MWFLLAVTVAIGAGIRLAYCFLVSADLRPIINRRSCLTMVAVLGSGGHTAEMLMLLRHLNQDRYQPLHFVIADTDSHSATRAALEFDLAELHRIPRARHVGQPFYSAVISTLVAFLHTIKLIYRLEPQAVICNGPGTCVPVCFAAFLFRVVFFRPCKLIFVESFCRVRTVSLSGRLLRPIIDEFYVQWPSLHDRVRHSKYIGPLY